MVDPKKAIGCRCQCGAKSAFILRVGKYLLSSPCSKHVDLSLLSHCQMQTENAVEVYLPYKE